MTQFMYVKKAAINLSNDSLFSLTFQFEFKISQQTTTMIQNVTKLHSYGINSDNN